MKQVRWFYTGTSIVSTDFSWKWRCQLFFGLQRGQQTCR